jgi:large subunit ribosomal protein L35
MPKLKTCKSAAKRFRKTKKGKFTRHRAGKSHLLAHKTSKRKRGKRRTGTVSHSDLRRLEALLPY